MFLIIFYIPFVAGNSCSTRLLKALKMSTGSGRFDSSLINPIPYCCHPSGILTNYFGRVSPLFMIPRPLSLAVFAHFLY